MISQAKRRAQKLAAWKATPPAKICKPLRYLDSTTGSFAHDDQGKPYWAPGKPYLQATHAAKYGNGAVVNRLARAVLLGVIKPDQF